MFVSAKMMTVVVGSEMDYKKLLLNTDFDFSVISLVCNVSDSIVFLPPLPSCSKHGQEFLGVFLNSGF